MAPLVFKTWTSGTIIWKWYQHLKVTLMKLTETCSLEYRKLEKLKWLKLKCYMYNVTAVMLPGSVTEFWYRECNFSYNLVYILKSQNFGAICGNDAP